MPSDGLELGDPKAVDGSRAVARYDASVGDLERVESFHAWVLKRWAERVASRADGAVEVALVDVEEHDGLQLAAIDRDRREATIAAPAEYRSHDRDTEETDDR